MEKVNRKTTKLCSFYVSDWHLVTMILPYLNEEINKENKIVTLLEKNIKEKVETLVKKLNLKNSKQILNINWNIIKTKKYLELKNILNNESKGEKNDANSRKNNRFNGFNDEKPIFWRCFSQL